MTTELTLPEVGGNIESGTVVDVMVQVGDTVAAGDTLLELETEKAVIEVPAAHAGTIVTINVEAGQQLAVGGVIATVCAATESGSGSSDTTAEQSEVSEKPKSASSDADSDEATAQQRAQSVDNLAPADTAVGSASTPQSDTAQSAKYVEPVGLNAAPNVRRLAREMQIDLSSVSGTGLGGRITYDDLQTYRASLGEVGQTPAKSSQKPTPATAVELAQLPLPDFSAEGDIRVEDMSAVRRATAKAMAQAWTAIPMVTHFDKADITETDAARRRLASVIKPGEAKLTMTHVLIKALATTLREFPRFNASVDSINEQIIYKEYVNIAVAVETPAGLLVPVVRDADKKSLSHIVHEVADLAERARERKLTIDEMQAATCTLSNLGGLGGTAFTPIVNHPQVAVLGAARASMEPVWSKETETFSPRLMLPLSLSYDHRIIDGADAARFTRHLAQLITEPLALAV